MRSDEIPALFRGVDSGLEHRTLVVLARKTLKEKRRNGKLHLQGTLLCCLVLFAPSVFSQNKSRTLDDFFSQARELERKEDFAGAERIYLQAAEAFPNQPEIQKRLAIVLQTELKLGESIQAFEKVLKNDPQYPEVNFFVGLSCLGLNRFEQAIAFFDKELQANQKYRRARYYKAVSLQSLGRKLEAAQQFDILVRDDPNDSKVWYQLARLYKSMSIQSLKKLSNLEPDSVLILAMTAETYAEVEKYDDAVRQYQEILKKQPDFAGVHFAIGEIYWKTGRTDEADKEIRLALREDPNNPMANYYLGDVLLKNRKPKEAIPLLQIAATDPNFLAAQFQLGKSYMQIGQLEDALRVLSKVAEMEPDSKTTHYQLAQVYARLNNDEKRKYHLSIFDRLNRADKERTLKRSERLSQMEKLSPETAAPAQPVSTTPPTAK